MKFKPWILWIILITAYLLSSAVKMKFSLHDGYEFHGMWYSLVSLPVFDAGGPPSEFLSSIFIGYLVFVVFGIVNFIRYKGDKISLAINVILVSFSGYGIYSEVSSIIQDYNSEYYGDHFRIGPTLFILGLWHMFRIYRIQKQRIKL